MSILNHHLTGNYTLYAAVLMGAVAVVLVAGNIRQRYLHRKTIRQDTTGQQPRASRTGEDRLTFVVAALATAVSADGMWKFFDHVLHFPIYLRVAVFAFLELAMFTSALRARKNLSDPNIGAAGVDGVAVWAFTCLSAVLSAMDSATFQEAVFRLSAPLVAAWLWERGMSIERRRTGARTIHWRITPERLLVRLGVAEASDRTATEVDAHRRIGRVARAAKTVRILQSSPNAKPKELEKAQARLDRATEAAVEHAGLATDPDRQQALRAQVGALFHAASIAELEVSAPWTLVQADPIQTAARPALQAASDTGDDSSKARKSRRSGAAEVDRHALVAELAEAHLDGEARGVRYRPDWEELKARTGNQQRWLETVWRDAKRQAAQLRAEQENSAEETSDGQPAVPALTGLADWEVADTGRALELTDVNGHGAAGGES